MFEPPVTAALEEACATQEFVLRSKDVEGFPVRTYISSNDQAEGSEQGRKATAEVNPLTTKSMRYVQDRSARTNLS